MKKMQCYIFKEAFLIARTIIIITDNARAAYVGRTRDDSNKKGGNASSNSDSNKRSSMEVLASGDPFDNKEAATQEKTNNVEGRDGMHLNLKDFDLTACDTFCIKY